jgi:hypothetical protein
MKKILNTGVCHPDRMGEISDVVYRMQCKQLSYDEIITVKKKELVSDLIDIKAAKYELIKAKQNMLIFARIVNR